MIIRTTCLCGNEDVEEVFTVQERTILACPECSLRFTKEREDNYESFYTDGLKYHLERENEIPYKTRFDHDKQVGELRLQEYRSRVRILDVGCANGGFIAQALEEGYDAEGLEINPSMAEFAAKTTGAPIHTTWETVSGKFDMITYHDVLEHISDPARELNRAESFLDSGGRLIVDVPSTEDPRFVLLGPKWHHMKPHEHLWFFNEKSFRKLLEYHVPGLDVVDVARPIRGKLVIYLRKRDVKRFDIKDWSWEKHYGTKSK